MPLSSASEAVQSARLGGGGCGVASKGAHSWDEAASAAACSHEDGSSVAEVIDVSVETTPSDQDDDRSHSAMAVDEASLHADSDTQLPSAVEDEPEAMATSGPSCKDGDVGEVRL